MNNKYIIPDPILDKKEFLLIDSLTERYNKLAEPGMLVKIGQKASDIVPVKLKEWTSEIGNTITQQELYMNMMNVIGQGFKTLEEQVAKFAISENQIISKINSNSSNSISSIEEICLNRSYDIAKAVNSYKNQDIIAAVIEGGGTSAFGFWGLPFNIVLSTFLYFRAVQSIAMFYGYDVRNDAAELVIASEVFTNALSPMQNDSNSEITNIIGKIMLMSQASIVKQTAKRTWTDMATRGGMPLLLTQMRALANKWAKKALEKAGEKGLENSIFREAFELIGKKLSLKVVGKAVPVISAAIGALIDTSQMKKVLEYADVFYQKRFILEKEKRVLVLTGEIENIIEAEIVEE